MEGRRGRASSAQHSGGLLAIRGAQWPVGQLLGETDQRGEVTLDLRLYGLSQARFCLRCPEKPRQAVLQLARGTHGARSRRSRCCEDLVAALVAMFNDPKKAFQPTGSP